MIVDSHTHVASLDTDRYPTSPTGVGSNWWSEGPNGADELLSAMAVAGVDRAVVVQAVGVYGYDCRYAIDAVTAHPEQLALVGAINMEGDDPPRDLAILAANAPLGGVRLFGVGGTSPGWLADGRADEVWAAAAELGCSIIPTLFAADLPGLRSPIEAHPRVPVIVDHCGFPDLTGGAPYDSATTLFDMADLGSVSLKVSSHILLDARAAGDPADLIDRLAETFGADRLCWGSDYPQTQALSYAEMVDLGRHAARRLAPLDQDAFLGGTSAALWWNEMEDSQ